MLPLAASNIDEVTINFSDSSLIILGAVLAVIMFGIALDTKVSDFEAVKKMPLGLSSGSSPTSAKVSLS